MGGINVITAYRYVTRLSMMQAFVFISLYVCPKYVYGLVGVSLAWWNSAKTKQVVGITQQIRLTAYVCLVLYLEEGGNTVKLSLEGVSKQV